MDLQSRRSVLGTAAGATTLVAAGCLDALPLVGDDEADSDDEVPPFSEWVPATGVDTLTYGEVPALEGWPDSVQTELGIDQLLAFVPLDGIESLILMEGDVGSTQVFTGSFDPAAVRDELDLPTDPDDEQGDFELYDSIAISSDAVVIGDGLERVIDAKRGDTDRLADEDETWHAALTGVRDTPFAAITAADGTLPVLNRDGVELRSLAIEGTNGEHAVTVQLFYVDAVTASADVDDLEDELAAAALFQDVTVERDEAVVDIEGTVAY